MFSTLKPGDKSIYKLIRTKKKKVCLPPLNPAINEPGLLVRDSDKASALLAHFKNMHANPLANQNLIFTLGVNTFVDSFIKSNSRTDQEFHLNSRDVAIIIKSLKKNKAPGADNIPVVAIKNLSHFAIDHLTLIYQSCLRLGYFPQKWKFATAIPIHKPGKDPRERSSYRPISLIGSLSKVFEKIINNKITAFNDDNSVIPNIQFGFRKGHSTNHALCYLCNHIRVGFKNKMSTAAIAFDIEKAFDRTWQNGLIYKMIHLKYPTHLIKITNSFIKCRKFNVRVGQSCSAFEDIPWGVPQGSSLSPSLYNIFVSDIPSGTARTIMYADDTLIFAQDRLFKKITSQITETAAITIAYFKKWKVAINTDKTALTYFTYRKKKQIPKGPFNLIYKRKVNPGPAPPIVINAVSIPWSSKLKYLGVTLDKRLTLKTHITGSVIKLDRSLRLLYPFLAKNSALSAEMKILLYKLYCRPILSYGAPILALAAKSNIDVLNRKQNVILRRLLGMSWGESAASLERAALVVKFSVFLNAININFKDKCSLSSNSIISTIYS